MGLTALGDRPALLLLPWLAMAGTATAEGQRKLPAAVQKELSEMVTMCREAGGKALKSPGLLTVADLNGDRLPDFVIDQAAFVCDGAASLFGGSGGSTVSAYVGTPDGQAAPAFSSGAFGVKVDKAASPAVLEVIVSGPMCGQKVTPATPRSAYKSCWRPLVWDAARRQLDFAPLSRSRPVQ